jgi:hypothetical protein
VIPLDVAKSWKSNACVHGTGAALRWSTAKALRSSKASAPEGELLRLGTEEEGGMNTGRMSLIGIGLGLYLLGFGMLAGMTVERMRFDHKRTQMLARYDRALREWHAFRIELEKAVARP